MDEPSTKALLRRFGISIPRGIEINDAAGDLEALTHLTPPFVVKIISDSVVHKSDIGGVELNLRSTDDVRDAAGRIARKMRLAKAPFSGFLVEEQLADGVELIVGGIYDASVGHVLMLGLGGVFVEILNDVSFRAVPISEVDAAQMISELRGHPLLDGVRGYPAVDRAMLERLLLKIGGATGLLMRHPEITEIDINPVIATADSVVAVDATCTRRPGVTHQDAASDAVRSLSGDRSVLDHLFTPSVIAVAGASSSGGAAGNRFIAALRDFGFTGRIYPIHPSAREVDGLEAYQSWNDVPEFVDYVYLAVPAAKAAQTIADGQGNAAIVQVLTAGFSEVSGGEDLERELLATARRTGTRVIGPNCLGTYCPRGHMTFTERTSTDAGTIGVISQSGGLSVDIIRRGYSRGLRFSGVVSIGNGVDVAVPELLDYLLHDDATKVIGIYLESLPNGRALLNTLRRSAVSKPIVVLKGGMTSQGAAAARSHTGGLAVASKIWEGLAAQARLIPVDTLDAFLDTLAAFQDLDPHPANPTTTVALFGNGGGTSVLAADAFDRAGLAIRRFSQETIARLLALDLPAGTSVANPIDAPGPALVECARGRADRVFDIVLTGCGAPDVMVTHLNIGVIDSSAPADLDVAELLTRSAIVARSQFPSAHHVLVLRSDGDPRTEERKRYLSELARVARLPVFDEMYEASAALQGIALYETFLATTDAEHSMVSDPAPKQHLRTTITHCSERDET